MERLTTLYQKNMHFPKLKLFFFPCSSGDVEAVQQGSSEWPVWGVANHRLSAEPQGGAHRPRPRVLKMDHQGRYNYPAAVSYH